MEPLYVRVLTQVPALAVYAATMLWGVRTLVPVLDRNSRVIGRFLENQDMEDEDVQARPAG